jgi:hypothetical protein
MHVSQAKHHGELLATPKVCTVLTNLVMANL